jgi:hypothetical protein
VTDDLRKPHAQRPARRRGCLILALVGVVLAIVVALTDGLWFVLLFIGFNLVDGLFQPIMTVPSIRGRVVELQTGQPVQGVRVTRAVIAWALPSGLEESPLGELPRSRAATITDSGGAFSFPPVRFVRGFHLMQWRAYREGWMPGDGRIWRDKSSNVGFKETANNDLYPWVVADCQRQDGALLLTIRVSRPTMNGITYPKNVHRSVWRRATRTFEDRIVPPPEPWGVYFDRLRWMALHRELDKAEVGRQALQHVSVHGPIGEDGVLSLLEIAGWVPAGSACAKIVDAVLSYCDENTASDRCEGLGPQENDKYLEYRCGVTRGHARSP